MEMDIFKNHYNVFSVPSHIYNEQQLATLLENFKASAQSFVDHQVHGPIYLKALVTLKYLFEEQAVDDSKFRKVR